MSKSGYADPAIQVNEARNALRRAAQQEPDRWWTADELRRAAQNGFPSTVVSAALNDLVEGQELRLNNHLHIQYVQ